MNTNLPPIRPPRRVAAPWLLATTLLAAGFAAGPAAHAALVVTAATRSASADTSLSAADSTLSNSTGGAFTASAVSETGGNGALAVAELKSVIDPLVFRAQGVAAISLANNASGQAESLFDVFFTLTTAFSYSGLASLGVDDGNAARSAIFVLEEQAGTDIVNGSNLNPLAPFAGTLAPGGYHLLVRASTGSIDPNEAGLANFSFALNFVDQGTPPAGVPEPSGAALAAVGAFALRRVRRRS